MAIFHLEVPKKFSVVLQPGLGFTQQLPVGLCMDEALQHVKRFLEVRAFSPGNAILYWASLKTIFFRSGMPPSEDMWPPDFGSLGVKINFGCPPTH